MSRLGDAWRVITGSKRAVTSADAPWSNLLEGSTSTGTAVSPESSLRVSTVYAGVRLISESIAALPVDVIRRNGSNRRIVDSPVGRLISEEPNPEMDAGELWRTVLAWMLLRGDAYVYVERARRSGRPIGLWPLPATDVLVGRTPSRQLFYRVSIPQGQVDSPVGPGVPTGQITLGGPDVMHFKAFGTGLYGFSPVGYARESVAVSLAAQHYTGRFYRNDARPGGVISVDGELSDAAYRRLHNQWRATHQGVERSHMLAILEGGAKWENVGLSPEDAAFIESRKFEAKEIGRIFAIPPHLLGETEQSTWGAGIAAMGEEFVRHTLSPWMNRLERVVHKDLLAPIDDNLHARWRAEGLQRGDQKARYEAYAIGRNWGWLSVNDVRAMEDMDSVPGGDTYLQPLNMVPAGSSPPTRELGNGHSEARVLPAGETRQSELLTRTIEALRTFFREQGEYLISEIGPFRPDSADALWVRDDQDHRLAGLLYRLAVTIATERGQRVVTDYGDHVVERIGGWLATHSRYSAENINRETARQVDTALSNQRDEDSADVIRGVFASWVAGRVPSMAQTHVTSTGNYAAVDAGQEFGASTKTWRTVGPNTRAEHAAVDGQTVRIGETFDVGGFPAKWPGDPDLPQYLSAGCDCSLDVG